MEWFMLIGYGREEVGNFLCSFKLRVTWKEVSYFEGQGGLPVFQSINNFVVESGIITVLCYVGILVIVLRLGVTYQLVRFFLLLLPFLRPLRSLVGLHPGLDLTSDLVSDPWIICTSYFLSFLWEDFVHF